MPRDIEEIQESDVTEWRIEWEQAGDSWSRETTLAAMVFFAERDPMASVEPL